MTTLNGEKVTFLVVATVYSADYITIMYKHWHLTTSAAAERLLARLQANDNYGSPSIFWEDENGRNARFMGLGEPCNIYA